MLSIENPPPDPYSSPCCELKSSSSHEPAEVAPDLSKSKPPSNFSIRDYVFTARSKDIKKNWPFSLNNLQLCVKHGVKDVLPPFRGIERNQSVETNSAKEIDANDHVILDTTSDDAQLNHKVVDSNCTDGGTNDFPSTTTSFSQSEIESVQGSKLLEPLVEVRASGPPAYQTIEKTTRHPGKKCRLIVQFVGNSDRSSIEDIVSNCTNISETMASKVCPVCKTFSSSSNTTLNAHIDQCLSGESVPKWTSDSKLSRHKIKPRKTRLMVDVYATAQRCTLEELDRRNGTNWAKMPSLPSKDTEMLAERRKQRVSQIHPQEYCDIGSVYIDSNGTKVRILSKFSDVPTMLKGDIEPRKSFKAGKGNKFFKETRQHVPKYHKHSKLSSQSKKLRSYKAHKSQIYEDQEQFVTTEVGRENNEVHNFKSYERVKPNDCGTLKKWACTKRTGLAKKFKSKGDRQPLRCELHVARDLMVEIETDQPHSSDSLLYRSRVQKFANLSENIISFAEVSDRMDIQSHERNWSPGRKRMRSSLVVPRICGDVQRSFSSMRQKTDQPSKDTMSICERRKLKPPRAIGNCASLEMNEVVETHAGPANNSDVSPQASAKKSSSCFGFSPKALTLSSLRRKVMPVGHSPGAESKFIVPKKSSACNKPQVHVMGDMDEELVIWHSEVNEQHGVMQTCTVNRSGREDFTDELSPGSSVHGREISISRRLKRPRKCYSNVEGKDGDCSNEVSDDITDYDSLLDCSRKAYQTHGEDTVAGSPSKILEGDGLACLSKSLDTQFHKLGNSMKTQPNSLRSIGNYNGPLIEGEAEAEAQTDINDTNFIDGQLLYSADEVDNVINVQNSHSGTELNFEIGQGITFLEVDPIPIPGPPGSFLPSPRGVSSEEDFQGNSSLTTSRFQSSLDQHDLLDGGSSDSPISATSAISKSIAARYDVKFSEPLFAGSCTDQDKIGSGILSVDVEPSVENACIVAQTANKAAERLNEESRKITIEKGERLSFINDDQPCCCSRKERIVQCVSLNYQEPQLLRRLTMASVTVPAAKKLMYPNNRRADPEDVKPAEMFPSNGCPYSGSEKVFPPVATSPLGSFPSNGITNVGVKYLGLGDCDFATPSASNPILRLMGKNLMVINKDGDSSMAQVQAPSRAQSNHLTPQFPSFSGIHPRNIRNQDCNSSHPFTNQGPVHFSQDQQNTIGQQTSDVRLSNVYTGQPSSRSMLQTPGILGPLFRNGQIGGSFAGSVEPEYNRHNYRLNESSMYDLKNGLDSPCGGSFPVSVDPCKYEGHSRHNRVNEPSMHDLKKGLDNPYR